ncbi:hypothetical protein L195_g051405, partial [Trifolium pratense]
MGSSLDSAYEYLLDELPELILISYEIVKQGNHAESDRFKRRIVLIRTRKFSIRPEVNEGSCGCPRCYSGAD